MICLRCGYCCTHLDVSIVNPLRIRPDGSLDPRDSNPMMAKPAGMRCPHLAFLDNKAVCTIHHLSCYRGTPCEQFEQFGPQDDICILGAYFRSTGAVI